MYILCMFTSQAAFSSTEGLENLEIKISGEIKWGSMFVVDKEPVGVFLASYFKLAMMKKVAQAKKLTES